MWSGVTQRVAVTLVGVSRCKWIFTNMVESRDDCGSVGVIAYVCCGLCSLGVAWEAALGCWVNIVGAYVGPVELDTSRLDIAAFGLAANSIKEVFVELLAYLIATER